MRSDGFQLFFDMKIGRHKMTEIGRQTQRASIRCDDASCRTHAKRRYEFVRREALLDPDPTSKESERASTGHHHGQPILDETHIRRFLLKPIPQLLPPDPRRDTESPPIGQDETHSATTALETHLLTDLQSNRRTPPGQGIERKQVPPIAFDRNHIDALDFVGSQTNLRLRHQREREDQDHQGEAAACSGSFRHDPSATGLVDKDKPGP